MSKVLYLIREFRVQRISSIIKAGAACAAALLVVISILSFSYSENVNKGLADNLIRLHVVANSDSETDQQLKRDIRDTVLVYMKEQLKDSKDLEQTKYIIQTSLPAIEKIAAEEIVSRGFDFPVEAKLGSFPFPTKTYGDIVLPAGDYQALKIVVGKGEGANWWCVLFPPLCFVDAAHGTVPEDVKEQLKETLTAEEYGIITSADSEQDIPIRVRFKVVDFFQESKIKFTGMISKLFGEK